MKAQRRRRDALPVVAASLGSGLLLTAGLAPFGWWPLALLGAGGLAALLHRRPFRHRLAVAGLVGLGFLGPGLWWMSEFSAPGYVLAVLVETAIFALGAAAAPPRWSWLGLPAALVLTEALRGAWPFGGVPIATLAQTQVGGPLAPAARLGGVLLVAAAVAIGGIAVAALSRRDLLTGGLAAAVVLVLAVGGAVAPRGRTVGTLDAALVQGGGDRGELAAEDEEESDRVFAAHVATSEEAERGLDLILWPEDTVDVEGDVARTDEGERLAELAQDLDTAVVAGAVEGLEDRFRNEMVAWGPGGEVLDRYEKNQRVPFGEYIPFRSLVEDVADVSAVPRDATVGEAPGVLELPFGDVGVLISYEVFFPRRARDALVEGVDVILVPTNAASFTTTQMPAIELAAARLRALESGRMVLQAAPTGFSAVIDVDGNVLQASDLGQRELLTATVERREGATIYTRTGDGPWVAAATTALTAAWFLTGTGGRRSRRRRPPRLPAQDEAGEEAQAPRAVT